MGGSYHPNSCSCQQWFMWEGPKPLLLSAESSIPLFPLPKGEGAELATLELKLCCCQLGDSGLAGGRCTPHLHCSKRSKRVRMKPGSSSSSSHPAQFPAPAIPGCRAGSLPGGGGSAGWIGGVCPGFGEDSLGSQRRTARCGLLQNHRVISVGKDL